MTRDPYAVLGVSHDASDDDLDHAFRGLVRRLHPDTRASAEQPVAQDANPDADMEADRRLQELLTAYACLRDPIRRAAFDRARARPAARSGAPATDRPASSVPVTPTRAGPAIRVGPVRWEPLTD